MFIKYDKEIVVKYIYELKKKEIISRNSKNVKLSKEGLKYKLDEYLNETHDTLFLKSIIYILMDCLKWYKKTSDENPSKTQNERSLWSKVF